jgi:2-methylcitrate dehydratase PrpD
VSGGERLAGWAATARWEDLPGPLRARLRAHVLDWLGVVCAGVDTPHARAAQATVRAWGGVAASTVIGRGVRLPAPGAAFLNAFAARAHTFDDTCEVGPVHPGSSVVAAAWAAAEASGASGRALLDGVLAGYEVTTRVSAAVGPGHYEAGFHNTGTCNAFGACAAAGRVLGLDGGAMAEAFGLAGAGAAGLRQYQVDGSMADTSLDGARAAHTGVVAAELRRHGLAGPRAILDGRFGFCQVTSPRADLDRLDRDLGVAWEWPATGLKPFPTCRFTHGPAEVLLRLRAEAGIAGADVARVTIATFKQSVEVSDKPEVRSRFDAILSHQWTAALALGRGRVDLAGLDGPALADPALRDLATRVQVAHDPGLDPAYPARWPHAVTIVLRDGRRLAARSEAPPGGADRPLADEAVEAKFSSLAGPVLGAERAARLADAVRALDALPDVRRLTPLLAP